MFQKILVAYDGSKRSDRALKLAIALAREQGSDVWVISVAEHPPRFPATISETKVALKETEEAYIQLHHKARMLASEEGVTLHPTILHGHAGQTIIKEAAEGHFDLLILGRSRHSKAWQRIIGSTADKVSHHAPCSVLIVR
jgi:nucleotide-binding universal stress UspA family protein